MSLRNGSGLERRTADRKALHDRGVRLGDRSSLKCWTAQGEICSVGDVLLRDDSGLKYRTPDRETLNLRHVALRDRTHRERRTTQGEG
jgi:hypothetical protein